MNPLTGKLTLNIRGGVVHQETFTVYVVDDDPSVRKALERLLRSAGYHALTFESAEDFLRSTSAFSRGCLVLDIHLPGITGLDLHEKLVSQGKKYEVIFITAHDNPQWQKRARKAGAISYLKKPFGEQSLLDAIELCFRAENEKHSSYNASS